MDNNPYPAREEGKNIYYDTFREEPKHFDPARAYSDDEYKFINQIYEPVVQYHYLKRPYTLVPLTASSFPEPKFFDKDGKELSADAPTGAVAKSIYEIHLRPDAAYQNHACFAKSPDGSYRWHLQANGNFPKIANPDDLEEKGTRELRAEDYVYQIKRMANPALECPIADVLSRCIGGFKEFQDTLKGELQGIRDARRKAAGVFYNQEADERINPIYLDLRKYDFPGVQVVDANTFRIVLSKKYPQFMYWLAMPFFSPMPWEADRFYSQPAAAAQNITLDRFPVGTGAFYLAVNQPNFRLILNRNPHYHTESYPSEGEPEDEARGLLADRGKMLPFLDEAIYTLEKESVPEWTKFLQGYYDTSGIEADMFDQAVHVSTAGSVGLTESMKQQHIRLSTAARAAIYYHGFNMLDDVVGGYDEKKCKLRQALSIAIDEEEYIQIFNNGRGIAAQGPVPPGIFGYQEGKDGINPYVYEWDNQSAAPKRKSIEAARQLLAEAGYPNGRDQAGNPLVISYDTSRADADAKAEFDWLRKQFEKIGAQLQVHATDYNRFQDKLNKGNFQLMSWGWLADYPDPENFLFLLYGPNSKAKFQQENASNYANPKFDALFKKMENMSNSPQRESLIREMAGIAQKDTPWVWGFHPVDYGLYHEWYKNAKPMTLGGNTLKYKRIDINLREQRRAEWNRPITWPLWAGLAFLILGTLPAAVIVYRREHS